MTARLVTHAERFTAGMTAMVLILSVQVIAHRIGCSIHVAVDWMNESM